MLVFTISGPFHSWCWFTLVIISFIKPKPSSFHRFLLLAPADDDDDEDGLKWLLLYFIALILLVLKNRRVFKGDTAWIINLPEYPSSIDRAKITRSSEGAG